MSLSQRLKLIASLVPKGARVCDIGTDHARLPIYLIENNIAKGVIATDIRPLPLENAKKNVAASGVKGIELRLCDGLSAVKKSETDTVIIAGIGGEVISGIISRGELLIEQPYPLLILQPTTSPESLRRYLYENGFEILTENCPLLTVLKISVNEPRSSIFILSGYENLSFGKYERYVL